MTGVVRHLNARLIAVLSVFLCAGFLSVADAAPANQRKLTSEEQGASELIKPIVDLIRVRLKSVDLAHQVVHQHRASGANHDHSEDLWRSLHRLHGLVSVPKAGTNKSPVLVEPESMRDLVGSLRNFFKLGRELHATAGQGQIPVSQWNQFLSASREVVSAQARFDSFVNRRNIDYTSVDLTYNLSVELKPIPLKLDFIKGEIKLTHTRSFGPLSINAAGGVSGSRTGVTTIVVVADGKQRRYATGGRNIEFYLPASHVRIDGSVMTITALENAKPPAG